MRLRKRLGVRHVTLERDGQQIVVNYVRKTGAMIDAAIIERGVVKAVTDDPNTLREWTK